MFIDTATITVCAGNGGNGVNSLYRDKYTRKGIPDGGDGGDGGNVILRVSTDVHTLLDFKYRQTFRAEDGAHGSSKKQRGANGNDLIVKIPAGTLIYDTATKDLLRDLVETGDEFIAARGGRGGKGNRTRKPATKGEEGERRKLFIELKLIADVGIIGLPNAGKSTLISRVSKAHPKIASFPFTTKNPVLGVVEYNGIVFKAVEIPGLIEGSHRGRGLGDKFLRHAERTKFYIHLLDLSAGDAQHVYNNYVSLNREIELYSKTMAQKPQIIAANKVDVEGAREVFNQLAKKIDSEIISISAEKKINLDELLKKVSQIVSRQPLEGA